MTLPMFEEALEIGEGVEAYLRRLLSDAKWGVFRGPDNYSHDFAVHNGRQWFLVEVKDESNFDASGNLCVETNQGPTKAPSGISTSESTVTIHYFGDRSAIYRTQQMRLHIRANRSVYKVEPFGRADNRNLGILIPTREVDNEWWFDMIDTRHLPRSRVWSAA